MDSTSHGMNGAYMQFNNATNNFDNNQFYNDIQSFSNANSNDAHPEYDPALFDMPDMSSFSEQNQPQSHNQQPSQQHQPSQQTQQSYHQNTIQRQSQSPALPSYKPMPQVYQSQPPQSQQQQQYGQPLYDQRGVSQSPYDPSLMSRPSASPGPFDHFRYQQQPQYGNQNFDPRFIHYQHQRQASTPTQTFPPPSQQQPQKQQPGTPTSQQQQQVQQPQPQSQQHYMNIAARPPSQVQSMHGLHYGFQQNQPMHHHFIDPSMLNAGGGMPGPMADQQSRQMQASHFYSKPGPTIDPRTLQPMQMNHQSPVGAGGFPGTALPPPEMQGQYLQFQLDPSYGQQPALTPIQATMAAGPAKKSKTKQKKDAEDHSSDDDLVIEEEPEPKPPLLLMGKPADQQGSLMFEVVNAVWTPRNKPADSEKIRNGIAGFGDLARTVRDGWKAKNELLKKAEIPNSPSATEAPALKAAVAKYRETMEVVINRAIDLGHPSIMKRLGENQFTMSALYSFLLDRVNADDYNSSLVATILQLAVKFETLDEEQLERVKWTKILARFTKKSSNTSKDFAKQILDKAKTLTAKRKAEKVREGPGSPSAGDSKTSSVAGVKRSRDADGSNMPVTKKTVVKPSSKPLSVQIAERRKLQEREAAAAKAAKTDKSAGDTQPSAARPKPAVTAPPKISLMSASKKPGTSKTERAAASLKGEIEAPKSVPISTATAALKKDGGITDSPPTVHKTPSIGATSASSFLGYLADMEKPKEQEVKKTEEDPTETSEQRQNRLRKEARRRLRVSWKSDNELVETRIFEHDPEEETGHEDSMMRDAGDTTREGEMLKRHLEAEDMEEDEEEELDFYSPPSEVDFDTIDTESRNGNFVKFGGPLKPESPGSEAQDKHEEGNLMTMYSPREQPNTPKELPSIEEDDDDFSPSVDFGEPGEKVREREQQINTRKQGYQQSQNQGHSSVDLSAMLQNLRQPQAPPPQQSFDLQRALGMFSQPQQPSPTQQSQLPAGIDLQKLLAVSAQFTQLNQPQPPSQYVPQPVQPPMPNTSAMNPNLAAILGQLTGAQQPQQGLPIGGSGNPNPFTGNDSDHSNKKHDGQKKRGKAPLGPDGKPLNYKTQVCSFWKEGKCLKGDDCTYRHDE